jgi:hypothetical protein
MKDINKKREMDRIYREKNHDKLRSDAKKRYAERMKDPVFVEEQYLRCKKWRESDRGKESARRRASRQRDKDVRNSRRKVFRSENLEYCREREHAKWEMGKERNRDNRISDAYGMSLVEFNSHLKEQGGLCAICKTDDWGKKSPSIDHNHHTGKFRAILCNRCNWILGFVEKKPELIASMVDYLRRFKEAQE